MILEIYSPPTYALHDNDLDVSVTLSGTYPGEASPRPDGAQDSVRASGSCHPQATACSPGCVLRPRVNTCTSRSSGPRESELRAAGRSAMAAADGHTSHAARWRPSSQAVSSRSWKENARRSQKLLGVRIALSAARQDEQGHDEQAGRS